MSHGKKKWIVAYDGKIKRSNDRTGKDYWKDLRRWEPMEGRRWVRKTRKDNFCPQCKHVGKEPVARDIARSEAWASLRREYDEKFGEAERAWQKYRSAYWDWRRDGLGEYSSAPRPKVTEPPDRYTWLAEEFRRREFAPRWVYDTRTYLCFKCERKYEKQQEMWAWHTAVPGKKARYNWSVKWNRNKYRNKVRNLMQRAKYDEEYYDGIPPYTHDWLD